jgi:Glucoamylase and related glycosyl hydrolases
VGLVSAADPRFVSTLAHITGRLRHGDDLYRYYVADDFGLPTTAFTICTFWYIDALAATGQREEARRLFEGMLARRNHLGLLSEDIDPKTGELWGNLPADLFAGRAYRLRHAAVEELGGGILARLVIVSNRLALPNEKPGRAAGWPSRCASRCSAAAACGSAGAARRRRERPPRPSC